MKKSLLFALALMLCVSVANAQKFPGLDASPLDVAYFPDGLPLYEIRNKPQGIILIIFLNNVHIVYV